MSRLRRPLEGFDVLKPLQPLQPVVREPISWAVMGSCATPRLASERRLHDPVRVVPYPSTTVQASASVRLAYAHQRIDQFKGKPLFRDEGMATNLLAGRRIRTHEDRSDALQARIRLNLAQ